MPKRVPTHVVVLDSLKQKAEARLTSHRAKTGDGLKQEDYLKHVGRIAEAKVFLSDIEALRKQLRDDDDID